MASAALLRACLEVIHFTGLSKALRKHFQGSGSIFCLHHVCPGGGLQSGFAPNSKLEITPEFLRDIILLVRARGMETISLAQAIERLKHPKPNQKPFAVFTLDDGYKDNLVYGQPIFDELQCPFTVFVAPQIVDGSCEIWWRALEKIIARNRHIDIAIGVKAVPVGGHFFGSEHTLARYETAFWRPMLSDWTNFETWVDQGSKNATTRANEIWKKLRDQYVPPPLDPAIKDAIDAYVAKRREEIGTG